MTDKELINKAAETLKNSYSPYSEFCVGAAILTDCGEIFTGTNIENASYSATVCAERTALFTALTKGKRNFSKIAIVGGKNGEINSFCYPCGVCCQALKEFCDDSLEILLFDGKNIKTITLGELLPFSFGRDNLC